MNIRLSTVAACNFQAKNQWAQFACKIEQESKQCKKSLVVILPKPPSELRGVTDNCNFKLMPI